VWVWGEGLGWGAVGVQVGWVGLSNKVVLGWGLEGSGGWWRRMNGVEPQAAAIRLATARTSTDTPRGARTYVLKRAVVD